MAKHAICVADGDGIGPEIMAATLKILNAAKAPLEITKIEIGEKVYKSGQPTGMQPDAWDIIRKSRAFLKAPITTPQGGGYKSLNVTVRTMLGLYANVRPCIAYVPVVASKHPKMDVVIIRENEEDLYAGIEYRTSDDVYQAIKVISTSGSERIIRYAFEYAKAYGRKKVTCFTKDNILKKTDGEFHRVFDLVGALYPDIEKEHWIVDIGAAKLADTPEAFDVVVLPNLYGDILSDVAAQITGSVGLAGSANIGMHGAMFEAIHGSAPKRANQNVANPSGLILASVLMLEYLGENSIAETIHNAWLVTLEQGAHTYDIYKEGVSKKTLGTSEFADAVIANLGKKPSILPSAKKAKSALNLKHTPHCTPAHTHKHLDGIDLYVDWKQSLDELVNHLNRCATPHFKLHGIFNRGIQIYPNPLPETNLVDTYRCRFLKVGEEEPTQKDLIPLFQNATHHHLHITQIQILQTFDAHKGW